jgi:hypothetical protein
MPGFFGDQSDRLLRKDWTDDAQGLALELWSMFKADVPMTTDQPLELTRNNDAVPAVKIIDNTNGTSSPIQVVRPPDSTPSPQPNVNSGGGYSCCGSSGQNQQPQQPRRDNPPLGGGGNVGAAPPPGGGTPPPTTPKRNFVGTVVIRVFVDPDPFDFNGREEPMTATGCFPYDPDHSILGPTTAYANGFNDPATIQAQINAFMVRWSLDYYTQVSDTVGPPGGVC